MQRNRRGCDQGTCILLIRLLAILARFPLGRPFPRETAPHTAPALQQRPSLRLWCCMRRGVIALSFRRRRGVIALSFRLLAVCVCVCVCVCGRMHAITHTPGVHRRPSPVTVEGSLGYMGIDGKEVTEVPFFRVVFRYLNYMMC